jgi:hypothetical protein
MADAGATAVTYQHAALGLQVIQIGSVAGGIVKHRNFGQAGDVIARSIDDLVMRHAAEKIVGGNVVARNLGRIASSITSRTLRIRAIMPIRAGAVRHIGDIRIGRDHCDGSDLGGVGISAQQEVGGQVVFDRKTLEVGGAQGAAAAFAHLLTVIKDVNHRADIGDWSEGRIGVSVGIYQTENVVAVAAVIASACLR